MQQLENKQLNKPEEKTESVQKPKRKLNRLRVTLVALALISILATGTTFSSYKSISGGTDRVSVALFASDYAFDVPATEGYYPGMDPKVVEITITNFEGDKICEVSQAFSITAERLVGRLPLELQITKLTGPQNNEFRLESGVATKQTATFNLTISWPEQYNDHSYADEIDVVRVTIDATQID